MKKRLAAVILALLVALSAAWIYDEYWGRSVFPDPPAEEGPVRADAPPN